MDDVYSYSRMKIHNVWGAYGKHISSFRFPRNTRPANGTTDDTHQSMSTRFMVVREPLSRLLSSYLDKAYLPDHWMPWMIKFSQLTTYSDDNDFLRKHFDDLASRFDPDFVKGSSTTFGNRKCGKYLTFQEYINVVINYRMNEPHFMPVHAVCNPCKFNVTHVNTMTTFSADAAAILDRMSLSHLTEEWSEQRQVNHVSSCINCNKYMS